MPLQFIKANRVRQIISTDLYGELPVGRGGCRYIFTCIDVFSRYVHLYPIKKANAKTLIDKLINHYIPTYGDIESVINDKGPQYISKDFKDKLTQKNIKILYKP